MAHYYELRIVNDHAGIAADLAKHLQSRQYLGTAVVVCANPVIFMSVVRKYWFRLMRGAQKQRASTLNAEEILRLTRDIMHMQQAKFTSKLPSELRGAQVYFVAPSHVNTLPDHCYSIYLTAPAQPEAFRRVLSHAPDAGLCINYDTGVALSKLGLSPKSQLEAAAFKKWQEVVRFLRQRDIDVHTFAPNNPYRMQAIDDALDTLLGASQQFLEVAAAFQRALDLAQPPQNPDALQHQLYVAVARLAHRVQALTPGGFANQFTHALGDQETFFLHDSAREALLEEYLFTTRLLQEV
ncbi:MAG: hypothetical protein ACREGJ_00735 [Candidatus Saccharimonadales bacterium]